MSLSEKWGLSRRYTSKVDEERNEIWYFKDGVEIDPAEEVESEEEG